MRFHTSLLTAACAVGFLGVAAAAPSQHLAADTQDAGPTASSSTLTTSIILNVRDRQGLKNFIAETVTPGSPNYHHFLTVEQFRERFAPSNQAVAQLVRYLKSYGITVNEVYPDNLDISASGTAGQFSAAFSTQLHDYTSNGQRFHRPAWKFVLPNELSTLVLAVPGLSNAPGDFRPKTVHLGQGAFADVTPPAVTWQKAGTATTPGDYTVLDVAKFYDVNPLYQAGVQGRGQTIGVMTLANFNIADANSYWQDIGLTVLKNRIKKVMLDGGTPVAAGVGDDETSLDVEQSGGLAPYAKIRVYIAPNTNNGFIDLFYGAVADNQAGSVSISWGEPEEFYFAALNGGVDATGQLVAVDQALMEGAAQGQTFFAASGDAGAYDINRDAAYPYYSKQLSVDSPANDPYMTAAGGTTVAATEPAIPSTGCVAITIPEEQVWGWDYLLRDWSSRCLKNLGIGYDSIFPAGGGGGVSSFWSIPAYQQSFNGMRLTQPGQSLYYFPNYPSKKGAQDLIDLPGYFSGRNLPDLSLNADPETGYIVVDCTDFPPSEYPGCASSGWGGTSFVGPQLNGMTTLVDDAAGGRVGFLNPVIYAVKPKLAYGSAAPFNDIVKGDNWFYYGNTNYDNGSGIGTVNAANLAYFYMTAADVAKK
ncbi:MAG: S53 family peptidase [Steroidobacteraceae bacterium]